MHDVEHLWRRWEAAVQTRSDRADRAYAELLGYVDGHGLAGGEWDPRVAEARTRTWEMWEAHDDPTYQGRP